MLPVGQIGGSTGPIEIMVNLRDDSNVKINESRGRLYEHHDERIYSISPILMISLVFMLQLKQCL